MCGIFGFIARRGAACDRARFQGALTRLFKLSEPRGREASGLVIACNGPAQVLKLGSSPSRMLRSRDYGMFLDANLTALEAAPLDDDERAACDTVWQTLHGPVPRYNRTNARPGT